MGKQKTELFFEDFSVGDEYHTDVWKVTERDIYSFAELSGDHNRIHTDENFAAKSIYGERIAHGLLGLAMTSGLATKLGFADTTVIALRSINWKFTTPMRIGDIIKAAFIVEKVKDIIEQERGAVSFKVVVTNQRDERVQTGNWMMVFKKRKSE
jgi:acyl dehydratase